MSDEIIPRPEPSGALVPPPVHPPTALASATARPPRREESVDLRAFVGRAVDTALDALDTVGDAIAGAVGLR
ncbi:MAG TPA: hypothetical protein VL328_15375 [Gemmatimonadaceae bacterium]|jgi:hypothetical protein|nr:hypothetical protein [Gemmatimonadaceae bacterium]